MDLTSFDDSVLRGCSDFLIDRDAKFTEEFAEVLLDRDVKLIRIPPRSPNCHPHAERFVRSIKTECLDRMIFFGEPSLRRALSDYEAHFLRERNHQGIENKLIEAADRVVRVAGAVCRRERLGGLLNFYYRMAP